MTSSSSRPPRTGPTASPAPRPSTRPWPRRGIEARWVVLGRPGRRLGGRRPGRGPLDLGLHRAARGVPGLGPARSTAGPGCSTAPTCSPGTSTRPTSPGSAAPRRRPDPHRRAPSRSSAAGVRAFGTAGREAARRRRRRRRPRRRRPGRPAARHRDRDHPELPRRPARGSCSRWSSRCAPRARPRCSCSTAGPSPRSTSCPPGDEIRVHEHFGGASRPVPLRDEAADLALSAMAGGRAGARRTARLRAGRHAAARRRHPRGERARADRAGALPRRPARRTRSRSPTWWRTGSADRSGPRNSFALDHPEC